jgi:hypothetical protein
MNQRVAPLDNMTNVPTDGMKSRGRLPGEFLRRKLRELLQQSVPLAFDFLLYKLNCVLGRHWPSKNA